MPKNLYQLYEQLILIRGCSYIMQYVFGVWGGVALSSYICWQLYIRKNKMSIKFENFNCLITGEEGKFHNDKHFVIFEPFLKYVD